MLFLSPWAMLSENSSLAAGAGNDGGGAPKPTLEQVQERLRLTREARQKQASLLAARRAFREPTLQTTPDWLLALDARKAAVLEERAAVAAGGVWGRTMDRQARLLQERPLPSAGAAGSAGALPAAEWLRTLNGWAPHQSE